MHMNITAIREKIFRTEHGDIILNKGQNNVHDQSKETKHNSIASKTFMER